MIIEVEDKIPKITKDGVTIVKNIMRSNALEEVCCALLRQAAHNTNQFAGDGTTTSTIIASTIFQKGQRLLTAGGNPILIKKGIEIARDYVLEFLDEIKLTELSPKQIFQCAMVELPSSSGVDELRRAAFRHNINCLAQERASRECHDGTVPVCEFFARSRIHF